MLSTVCSFSLKTWAVRFLDFILLMIDNYGFEAMEAMEAMETIIKVENILKFWIFPTSSKLLLVLSISHTGLEVPLGFLMLHVLMRLVQEVELFRVDLLCCTYLSLSSC